MPDINRATETHTVPPFECKLPAGLLDGLSDHDRHVYVSIDEIKQAVMWSAETSAKTANRLEEVYAQALKTNGGLVKAKEDIVALQEQAVGPARIYSLGRAVFTSKWGWAGISLLIFVVAPWLVVHAPAPGQFISSLLTLLLGA